MSGIIGLHFEFPEVALHGALAVRLFTLCQEVLLVSGHLGEVLTTLCNGSCHGLEPDAVRFLGLRESTLALYLATKIQTVAVIAGCLCYAVCTKQHLLTTVLRVLTRFSQCTGHGIDTGTPFNFSHSLLAMTFVLPSILGGGRLVFAGQIDDILDLRESHGFVTADHTVFKMGDEGGERQLRTAYVALNSNLIHKCISNTTFEQDNNMTLVAIAR